MDMSTGFSGVQTLLQLMQCSELREFFSILGYKAELEKLKSTVSIAKAVLNDANSKQVQPDTHCLAQIYIDELTNVVYDTEDLLDEFVTLAQRKKVPKDEGNSSKMLKMRLFICSRFNPLASAYKISKRCKDIRKRLDDITNGHSKFGFKPNFQPNLQLDGQPTNRRNEETCSYVDIRDIIGREDDVDAIVQMLLTSDAGGVVSFLPIVGLGGLGKTTVAQLVYNHAAAGNFFDRRGWISFSDEGPQGLDLKTSLCKILHSITRKNYENLAIEHLKTEIQVQLEGCRFLLVLDNVSTENLFQWDKLAKFLRNGLEGSWVIVTTRSQKTAKIVGGEHKYELKGLSDEDSLHLFKMAAFGMIDNEQAYPSELVEIGKEIAKACANVPFAITTVGRLLRDQGRQKWDLFQEKGLRAITPDEDAGINATLKLNYHRLTAPLKTCFKYCSIFPKDYVFEKEMLINMWIAQDYIVAREGQSIEDAGEEYFSILLESYFFRDVEKNVCGEIIRFKMHGLMHDIAEEVAGREIHGVGSMRSLNSEVRHMASDLVGFATHGSFPCPKLRTFLHLGRHDQSNDVFCTLLANSRGLRTLDLSRFEIEELPSTLGELVHLRYLDLSNSSKLKKLPGSVTELRNLEVLGVAHCRALKKLPKALSKLTKLRVLDTSSCLELASMPKGMGMMSSLRKLPLFAVGGTSSSNNLVDQLVGGFGTTSSEKRTIGAQLEEIESLKELRGSLFVKVSADATYGKGKDHRRRYLLEHQCLTDISVQFPGNGNDEALSEDLQPHPNIRGLKLERYSRQEMPYWARREDITTCLPNLVRIEIDSGLRLRDFGGMERLPHLKFLKLTWLNDLEYIENTETGAHYSSVGTSNSQGSFFPSLEELKLCFMGKLQGWWRDDGNMEETGDRLLPSFTRLSKLEVRGCPKLAFMPRCPNVEDIAVSQCNANMQIIRTPEDRYTNLRHLHTDNVEHLQWMLPVLAFQHLHQLELIGDVTVENLSEAEEVFRVCSSSLQGLEIVDCDEITSLSSLRLNEVWEGEEEEEEEEEKEEEEGKGEEIEEEKEKSKGKQKKKKDVDGGMPWDDLHSLRFLTLDDLPHLVRLPNGMRHLATLQSLQIVDCANLESMPAWMPELVSLKHLNITGCSDSLKARCQSNSGEDWPMIQHIPNISIVSASAWTRK